MPHVPHEVLADLMSRRAHSRWTREMDREISEWFGLPWRRMECAALLGTDLISLVEPSPHQDENAAVAAAREVVNHSTALLLDFAHRRGSTWPIETAPKHDSFEAGVYWLADALAENVRQETRGPSTVSWYVTGECLAEALKIVQKWAANSTAGGHAPNAPLERICTMLLRDNILDFETVADVVTHGRLRDAVGDEEVPEDVRVAFRAAWNIGRYEMAYMLVEG